MAVYVAQLAAKHRSAATMARALTAITATHIELGHAPPLRRTARSTVAEHTGNAAVRKAAPVTVSALRAMVAACSSRRGIGTRDRALLVLGFATGARRSELAALDLADATETSSSLNVTIGSGRSHRTARLPYGQNPLTCPVRTLRTWKRVLSEHGHTQGPLFVRIDRHGNVGRCASGKGSADGRLSDRAVASIVHRTAHQAGLDPQACWSGHSLRRGMATEAYRTGADPVGIAQHGGWQSGSQALHGNFVPSGDWVANPLLSVGL
ncbi:MAG: tyrosine-type recombinase/integrase [Pseudonocardiaceae bacterium]